MTEAPAQSVADDVSYTYRPSVLGAAWSFRLAPGGIAWDAGRKSGHIAYRDIYRVRLSFRPVSMQSLRFRCEIWADGAPKLEIVSSSWKSMIEQVRQDRAYAGFVAELHRRIALAGRRTPVLFEHGSHPLLYWPGLIVFAGVALALAWLTVVALHARQMSGAVFVGGFMLLFLWQGGNFFRRNRPGVYRADALPDALMPKG
jgi:hypothetical protein